MSELRKDVLHQTHAGTDVTLAYQERPGILPPLLCLHGFGSTKEDYSDIALFPGFADRRLVMLDAPGFGASAIKNPDILSIPLLVDVAMLACDALGLETFHICGHSMGGLTALMLAHAHSDRVLSFANIEGNIAPEDCFLSRQIIEHATPDADDFLSGFIARVSERAEYSSAIYARALPLTVRASSPKPIFTSMVDLSDNTPLMDMFCGLSCPRVFIHGDGNRHLSYLGDLPERGVAVAEIPFSGHFPMYSNPPALWKTIADFITQSEAQA